MDAVTGTLEQEVCSARLDFSAVVVKVWPLTNFYFLLCLVKNHQFIIGNTMFSSIRPSNSLGSIMGPLKSFLR